jgi:L-ascorbate metabolism protein UlaG (beta-lactamase superfamily)
MRVTKHVHACVRIDEGERALLVDPGIWVEPEAYEGVDEILVTHEHVDHVDADALVARAKANSSLLVRAPAAIAEQLAFVGVPVEIVAAGDTLTVAGFAVTVVGGRHAEIYEGLPGCANVGYVVDGRVYHPGDSLHVPDERIELLLVPASAPWLKLSEALDFVRAVAAPRTIPVHDALLSDRGAAITDRWFDLKGNTAYSRLVPGDSVDV